MLSLLMFTIFPSTNSFDVDLGQNAFATLWVCSVEQPAPSNDCAIFAVARTLIERRMALTGENEAVHAEFQRLRLRRRKSNI